MTPREKTGPQNRKRVRRKPDRVINAPRSKAQFNNNGGTKAKAKYLHNDDVFKVKLSSVSMIDLQDHHCRWPEGDRFCGNDKHGRSSYCEYHSGVGTTDRRGYVKRFTAGKQLRVLENE
jgi:hypothetical protein